MNTLIGADEAVKIGDLNSALRGLWADLAQQQTNNIEPQIIGSYVRPDVLAKPATMPIKRTVVALKRSFNQKMIDGELIRFWHVLGPASHRNYGSDLSIEGLKQWGIL